VRRGARATLAALGAFLALGTLNNIAAALFAGRFGIGLLDLDGGASVVSPGSPVVLPEPGPARVQEILHLYSSGATQAHLFITLTLDLLFPIAGVLFGVIASRNLRSVLRAPAAIAAIGVALAICYGLSELVENTFEVLLLSGTLLPWLTGAVGMSHILKNALAGPLLAYIGIGYSIAGVLRLAHLVRSRRRRGGGSSVLRSSSPAESEVDA
jgi:hypothetical protein